eukprot:scaffold2202_cov72-Phaeocystis_antarctica.AAC.8
MELCGSGGRSRAAIFAAHHYIHLELSPLLLRTQYSTVKSQRLKTDNPHPYHVLVYQSTARSTSPDASSAARRRSSHRLAHRPAAVPP